MMRDNLVSYGVNAGGSQSDNREAVLFCLDLTGGVAAKGIWHGNAEDCIVCPECAFRCAFVNPTFSILMHNEEYVAVHYGHPRNPRLRMAGLRTTPLGSSSYMERFIPAEQYDGVVTTTRCSWEEALANFENCLWILGTAYTCSMALPTEGLGIYRFRAE